MFKDKLKKLRIEKGITQKELAENIYVSRSTIAKWENGNGVPSDINLDELCKYFNIEKEYFTKENDFEEISDIDINEFLSNKYKKYIFAVIVIFLAIMWITITNIIDSGLVFVIGLFTLIVCLLIYYFIRFKKISAGMMDDLTNKRYDEVLKYLKKQVKKSISVQELLLIYDNAANIFMIKGEEQKVFYLFDAYPELKNRVSLAYIQLVLNIAKGDKENIDYYYKKVKRIRNKEYLKQQKNADLLMNMINTKTFNEELYNTTNIPLIRHICENVKNQKDEILVEEKIESVQKIKKQTDKLSALFIILSIVSIWVGLFFMVIVNVSKGNLTMIESLYYLTKNIWVMYLAIPLPLSAIIYGIIKYKKYKTKACIIVGFIFMSLLLIYGSIGFMIDIEFSSDVSEIQYLEEQVEIDFPDDATILIRKTEIDCEGVIRFGENFEEYIKNNENFNVNLTEEYRNIIPVYNLQTTLKYDYFYLKEINTNEYIYLSYSIKDNIVYVCKFIITNDM